VTHRITSATADIPPPPRGTATALAPSEADVASARRRRTLALLVWSVPLVLLMIALYWRLARTSGPLQLGIFTWLYPAAVVAVIGALLWALVVEPNSRGNTLGDHLRAGTALDADSSREDARLLAEGKQAENDGREHAAIAHAALTEAQEQITKLLEVAHRGRQIAHIALGVSDMGLVRDANLLRPSMPHYDRIQSRIGIELDRQAELVPELERAALPALTSTGTPHAIYAEPHYLPPDIHYVDPAALPRYPSSTLATADPLSTPTAHSSPSDMRRVRWIALLIALALLLALGAVSFANSHKSNSAGEARPLTERCVCWITTAQAGRDG
jgi:hypothetical protein